MNDKQMLEMAAKAAGIDFEPEKSEPHPVNGCWWGLWIKYDRETDQFDDRYWNPLAKDGQALRLAVKLNLLRGYIYDDEVSLAPSEYGIIEPVVNGDPYAATRRAITRAAAEIGRASQ